MDKRTIIGLIFLAAILVLMPYYNKLIGGGEPSETATPDTTGEVETDITATAPGKVHEEDVEPTPRLDAVTDTIPETGELTAAKPEPAADTIPQSFVYVKTKRYEVTLSTHGGDIVSMVSREYKALDGEPMEMCPTEVEGANLPVIAYKKDRLITTEAFNFVTDADSLILSENNPEGDVTFVAGMPDGGIIQRRYHFRFDDYAFDHIIQFSGEESDGVIDESVLWWRKGLEPSDPDLKGNISRNYRIGYMMGGEYDDERFGSDEEIKLSFDGTTQFVATHNKYFVAILAPYEGVAAGVRCEGIRYFTDKFGDNNRQIPAIGVGLLEKGGNLPVSRHDLIYIGPRDHKILNRYARDFEETVDLGWSWLEPLTKLFMWIFDSLYSVLGNYGLVIIVFSILIKLVLLPLSRRQIKSMQRMKSLEPKLSALREQYKNDVKKLNEETMKLYKKENINPLGGCLPLLPQMPVFFALFAMLRNSFALRGAPFMLWIQDLSQKDPYYVIPILMGITMFVQQKMTVRDPKQKMMVYIMPAFFLFLFRNMPAGLVLYWLCFNIFSLVQTLIMEGGGSSKQPSVEPND